jgi:L-lactate dehydrogenase complex protein LldF
VITPHFRGLQDWKHLSGASSLCGACTETCPVGIDIHHHLLHNRRNAAREKPAPGEGLVWKLFAFLMRRPALYKLAARFAPLGSFMHPLIERTALDPVRAWTDTRDFPSAPLRSFRSRFKEHMANKAAAISQTGGAQ